MTRGFFHGIPFLNLCLLYSMIGADHFVRGLLYETETLDHII